MGSKWLAVLLCAAFLVPVAVSGGEKKKKNSETGVAIPADTPEGFLQRYGVFINDKERKAFKKLQTDMERQQFITDFWVRRDTDPNTPENECKDRIDERLDEIANDRFASIPGLGFGINGGFRGDMAKAYMLYGAPSDLSVISGERLFVDLMLWTYADSEDGGTAYAFLFYQPSGSGSLKLFPTELYRSNLCGAVNEILRSKRQDYSSFFGGGQCPREVDAAYRQLVTTIPRTGNAPSGAFIWALQNVSRDTFLTQAQALGPPLPASEVAHRFAFRISGESPEHAAVAGIEYLMSACAQCNSGIPIRCLLGSEFVLQVRRSDIDWQVTGTQAKSVLRVRVVLENLDNNSVRTSFGGEISFTNTKENITDHGEILMGVVFLKAEDLQTLPTGRYRASIYLRNAVSNKYASWVETITRP